jgi:hypothetical protein
MLNQVPTGNLDDNKLRSQAEQFVSEKDGKWVINQSDKPLQGIDYTKNYPTRDEAINAAFMALRTQSRKVA